MDIYLDTCIWMNIFNKQERFKEFKESKELVEKLLFNKKHQILHSGIIIKELKYKLEEKNLNEKEVYKKLNFLKNQTTFIKTNQKDYSKARELEKNNYYQLSFYDYLHLSICFNRKIILVTYDKELLTYSKKFIIAKKPKELSKRIYFI